MEGGDADFPHLNIQSDISLQEPDLDQLRHDRMARNKAVMKAVSPLVAAQVLHEQYQGSGSSSSPEDSAAICIQKWFRGYKGRKIYAERLYEQFQKEEAAQHEKVLQQMEEGELLVENHQLEVLLEDNKTKRRNQEIHLRYNVITIQRAWRAYLEKKQKEEQEETHINDSLSNHGNSNDNPQNVISGALELDNVNSNVGIDDVSDKTIEKSLELVNDDNILSLDSSSDLIFQNPLLCDSGLDVRDTYVGQGDGQRLKTEDKNTEIHRFPGEFDEDYNRRLKKHNFLKLAHKFVELKKVDASILPFDLHKYSDYTDVASVEKATEKNHNQPSLDEDPHMMAEILSQSGESFSSVVNKEDCDENENSKAPCDINEIHLDHIDSGKSNNERTKDIETKNSDDEIEAKNSDDDNNENDALIKTPTTVSGGSEIVMVALAENQDGLRDDATNSGKSQKSDKDSSALDEDLCPFDVYNIETALPDINWETLEESLKKASEEEKLRQEARRNDREEIRKKLAMGFDDDDCDNDDDEEDTSTYKKPNLQTRLQSGMNLQICFMNESPADNDSDLNRSPRQFEESDNIKVVAKAGDIVDSDNNLPSVADLNRLKPDLSERGECSNTTRLKSCALETEDQDFHSKQEQLQNEAKLALAQAGSMAHMQLEIEKQMKKKSPISDIVGIPGLGERRRKKLGLRKLQEMNLAQIQVLYNDLQTQIENLNEELVQMLMERDELHMEQDSMLVDVEDLTRRAEEIAEKAAKSKPKETTTCNSKLKGKLLGR